MNTDNNNIETNLGSESLGGFSAPVNNEPINNQEGETFSPFQDLNSAPLNVPTENLDSTQQAVPTEQATVNAAPTVEPSFYQPEIPAQDLNPQGPVMDSTNNVDSLNDTLNPEPVQTEVAGEPAPSFEPVQSAPTIDTFAETPVAAEPVSAPAEQNVGLADAISKTQQINVDPLASQPTVEENLNQGPTMPIPDQMPSTDYQAEVSTPVDYATPMSDFDQIGTTPELDPKAKGNKKKNKALLFILLLIIIGGIGYGSYYAINVMGIFEKDSVSVKEVTAEKGEAVSTNIDDYATFKNTSSSNCVLDTTKVNTAAAGSYEFTVTCGKKSYTGKVTVKDTKGPQIEAKTVVATAGTAVTADMLVSNADETATYAFASDTEASQFQTAGLKKVKITATDESGNAKTYVIPVIVTSTEYSIGIVAKKDVALDNTNANITEKNVILYNNGMVNDTSYTAYIIKFADVNGYKAAIKNYDDSGVLTYETYSGTPVFYQAENTLVLVKDINSDLIKEGYNPTFTNLREAGYETSNSSQISGRELIEFNK